MSFYESYGRAGKSKAGKVNRINLKDLFLKQKAF